MFARLNTQVLLLTATLALGACDSTLAPISVAVGCPDRPVRGPEAQANAPANRLIDDFEDGDVNINPAEGRDGLWVAGNDHTASDTNMVFEISPSSAVPDCSARGRHAAYFSWTDFRTWGANLTALFRPQATVANTWDGRGYGGVSFWAAVPAGRAPLDLPVGLTTTDNAWNGGVCNENAGKCMDVYAMKVHLTSTWQRFELRFTQLIQSGTGDPLTTMKRDKLVGLVFWPRHPAEFWLDDVRFEP
jgi:hypothetical protein